MSDDQKMSSSTSGPLVGTWMGDCLWTEIHNQHQGQLSLSSPLVGKPSADLLGWS